MISYFWFASFIAIVASQCPPNSLHLDNNDTVCYSFHSTLSKFAIAQTHCKSFGAQLVTLKSEYINHYITGFANLIFDDIVFFWSGGHRLNNPSNFEWSNGDPLEYSHFYKGNETKNGSCLAADVKQGFWKIENCFAEYSYVCEFIAGKNIIPDNADQLDLDGTTENKDSLSTPLPQRRDYTFDLKPTRLTAVKLTSDIVSLKDSAVTPTAQFQKSEITTESFPKTTLTERNLNIANDKISSTPTSSEGVDVCPQGYHHILEKNQCYKFNKEKLPWQDADDLCLKEGGHVTSIENEAENKFIVEFVTQQHSINKCTDESDMPWIGFSRLDDLSVDYSWSDGSEKNYTNWATLYSEPNNLHGNQKCVEIFVFPGCKFEVGGWNDLDCTLNHTSVCKQPAKSTPAPEKPCPIGWEYRNATNNCYFLSTEMATWEDAEAICQMEDAHLASVCDENENKFITDFINIHHASNNTCDTASQTWIGLTKLANNSTWSWIDGTESNFTKWSSHNNEPNNLHGNQFCVQIISDSDCKFKSGDWNDIECNSTQKVICKKPAAIIVGFSDKSLPNNLDDSINATNNSPCPSEWEYNNATGNCYKLNQIEITWIEAEAACKNESSHLVTIEDKNENDFVVEFVQRHYNHSKCERVFQLWIGYSRLNDDDNTTYQWADESVSNFTNWAYRQPDDRKGKEACAHLITGSKCIFKIGLWNDLSCQNTRYSVCEKPSETFENSNTKPKKDLVVEHLTKL